MERRVLVPLVDDADEVARLSFDNGLGQLGLHADADLRVLLDARFATPLPTIWARRHRVHVEYPLGTRPLPWMHPNTVRINPRTAWSIDVHGDACGLTADLTGVELRSLAFHAPAADIRLALDRPVGQAIVRLTSVTGLEIGRPADVPMRLELAAAASGVAVDGRCPEAVRGGLVVESPGYDRCADRYLVAASGTAATVTVTSFVPGSVNRRTVAREPRADPPAGADRAHRAVRRSP